MDVKNNIVDPYSYYCLGWSCSFDWPSEKSDSPAKAIQPSVRDETPYKKQDTNTITDKKQLPNQPHVKPPEK
jgi:hypothetical protein